VVDLANNASLARLSENRTDRLVAGKFSFLVQTPSSWCLLGRELHFIPDGSTQTEQGGGVLKVGL
jgi:hypothetical protein